MFVAVAASIVGVVLLIIIVVSLLARPAEPAAAPAASIATATPTTTSDASPTPPAVVTPSPSADAGDAAALARAQLASLETVSGYSDTPYDRSRFGQAWADVDRNGCDTRNDVLGRDLLHPVFKPGTRDCKVLSGLLIDPYDGSSVDFVSGPDTSVLVQIDHVVPLAWAWRQGAEHWTDAERTAFANDPANLLATSEDMNQEKGDSGPSEWLPPVPDLRCRYVEDFVGVLDAYDLGINAADRAAADSVLTRC